MHAHLHVHVHVHVHSHVHVHVQMRACVHACRQAGRHVCVRACARLYVCGGCQVLVAVRSGSAFVCTYPFVDIFGCLGVCVVLCRPYINDIAKEFACGNLGRANEQHNHNSGVARHA